MKSEAGQILSLDSGPSHIGVKGCTRSREVIDKYFRSQGDRYELSVLGDEDVIIVHFPHSCKGAAIRKRALGLQRALSAAGYIVLQSADHARFYTDHVPAVRYPVH